MQKTNSSNYTAIRIIVFVLSLLCVAVLFTPQIYMESGNGGSNKIAIEFAQNYFALNKSGQALANATPAPLAFIGYVIAFVAGLGSLATVIFGDSLGGAKKIVSWIVLILLVAAAFLVFFNCELYKATNVSDGANKSLYVLSTWGIIGGCIPSVAALFQLVPCLAK